VSVWKKKGRSLPHAEKGGINLSFQKIEGAGKKQRERNLGAEGGRINLGPYTLQKEVCHFPKRRETCSAHFSERVHSPKKLFC